MTQPPFRVSLPTARLALGLLALALATPRSALALDHLGGADQFAGGFQPTSAPWGGFGGGSCTVSRTPVVFLHGNGDVAENFDLPNSTGVDSVYEAFRAAGYNDCELFGLTWLSSSERALPQFNYHEPSKADLIADFLWDVKAYTGASQVDVVTHSLGVTMGLYAIEEGSLWSSVRRFVAIAGGLRGLASCGWVGYPNPAFPTCGSQNLYNPGIFGLFPHSWWTWNPRMGNGGFRDDPVGKSTLFYSIGADVHDEVLCGTTSSISGCGDTARFDARSNVRSQLDVGYGTPATGVDFDFSDWSIFNTLGGDADGVGHYRAKSNSGRILVNMLTTSCAGTGCCSGYGDVCGSS
ncbi:MAG: lipase family protein [Holophagales bacterium]|nr:lipase family protein [Holophagales bacterium]